MATNGYMGFHPQITSSVILGKRGNPCLDALDSKAAVLD